MRYSEGNQEKLHYITQMKCSCCGFFTCHNLNAWLVLAMGHCLMGNKSLNYVRGKVVYSGCPYCLLPLSSVGLLIFWFSKINRENCDVVKETSNLLKQASFMLLFCMCVFMCIFLKSKKSCQHLSKIVIFSGHMSLWK